MKNFIRPWFVLGFASASVCIGQTLVTQSDPLLMAAAFTSFSAKVHTRYDSKYFYVESNGIPDHVMMKGITGWQQQVPLPQCYLDANAWSIPLSPVMASVVVPVNPSHFTRGAIAVATNGIPIFNPYTNTGVDALVDGQLDIFGGHCGRADDYHYHTAPLHLESLVGTGNPIAYALDGFAIYGSKEPDGGTMATLDANHGHLGSNGVYHYHGTAASPYMIGNMVGVVTEDGTKQIIPQAQARPVRGDYGPLRGATITQCLPHSSNMGFTLVYTLSSKTDSVVFDWTSTGSYVFQYYTATGKVDSTYKGSALCTIPVTAVKKLGGLQPEKKLLEVAFYRLNGKLVYKATNMQHGKRFATQTSGIYLMKLRYTGSSTTQKLILPLQAITL